MLPAWLASVYGWGVFVAWSGASAFTVTTALILFVRFRQGKWKGMRVIEQARGPAPLSR